MEKESGQRAITNPNGKGSHTHTRTHTDTGRIRKSRNKVRGGEKGGPGTYGRKGLGRGEEMDWTEEDKRHAQTEREGEGEATAKEKKFNYTTISQSS